VKCCDHTARASGGSTIVWPGPGSGVSQTTTVNSAMSTLSACLPPDYVFQDDVMQADDGAPLWYKKVYSPVYQNAAGATVVLDTPPSANLPGEYFPHK
jgi:hypothetical protein